MTRSIQLSNQLNRRIKSKDFIVFHVHQCLSRDFTVFLRTAMTLCPLLMGHPGVTCVTGRDDVFFFLFFFFLIFFFAKRWKFGPFLMGLNFTGCCIDVKGMRRGS